MDDRWSAHPFERNLVLERYPGSDRWRGRSSALEVLICRIEGQGIRKPRVRITRNRDLEPRLDGAPRRELPDIDTVAERNERTCPFGDKEEGRADPCVLAGVPDGEVDDPLPSCREIVTLDLFDGENHHPPDFYRQRKYGLIFLEIVRHVSGPLLLDPGHITVADSGKHRVITRR